MYYTDAELSRIKDVSFDFSSLLNQRFTVQGWDNQGQQSHLSVYSESCLWKVGQIVPIVARVTINSVIHF
jgi:hypothetical protein